MSDELRRLLRTIPWFLVIAGVFVAVIGLLLFASFMLFAGLVVIGIGIGLAVMMSLKNGRDQSVVAWHDKHPDHCFQCGYDMSGIGSRVCPECGNQRIPESLLEQARHRAGARKEFPE